MYRCVYIFLSVCGVFKCTLYVRVNISVSAHACVRVHALFLTSTVSAMHRNAHI